MLHGCLEHPHLPAGSRGFHPLLQVDLVEAQRRDPGLRRPETGVGLELPHRRQPGQRVRIVHQVPEGDERMSLAAPVVDRQLAVGPVASAGQAQDHLLDQLAQIVGGIGEREKFGGILVDRAPALLHDHVVEIGGEHRQRQLSGLQIVAQLHHLVPGFTGRLGCHVGPRLIDFFPTGREPIDLRDPGSPGMRKPSSRIFSLN